jgi:hypothetical protein
LWGGEALPSYRAANPSLPPRTQRYSCEEGGLRRWNGIGSDKDSLDYAVRPGVALVLPPDARNLPGPPPRPPPSSSPPPAGQRPTGSVQQVPPRGMPGGDFANLGRGQHH